MNGLPSALALFQRILKKPSPELQYSGERLLKLSAKWDSPISLVENQDVRIATSQRQTDLQSLQMLHFCPV